MSKQKKLRNRLDDLFADLEEQATRPTVESETVPGWTWECDPLGSFTHCSPETANVLGLDPQGFLGKKLFSYRLDHQSTEKLRSIFEAGDFPCEVVLKYLGTQDRTFTVRCHIFPIDSIDEKPRGWRGFNQVISTDGSKIVPPVPPISKTTEILPRPSTPMNWLPSFGIAVERDQVVNVTKPSSSIGIASLQSRQSIVADASADSPATLAVPVELQEQSWGVLEIIDATTNRRWSQEDQLLVEQVADQLGLALENARLFQETQNSLARTEALYHVGQASIGFENLGELLQTIVNTIANVLPADRAYITVLDLRKNKLTHFYESYAPPHDINENTFQELMSGLTGLSVRERKPTLLPKRYDAPDTIKEQLNIHQQIETGSTLVVPLIYQENVFGSLTAINRYDQPDFTQGDVDLLVAMSNQVATALANARLFQEEQHRRQIADTLSETARVVGATLEIEDLGNRLLAQLSEVIEFETASLQIVEGDQRRLISRLRKTSDKRKVDSTILLPPISADLIIQSIVESGQPVVIPDTQADSRWTITTETKHIRSWIGAPLLSGNETIGLLFLDHPEPGTYDEETVDFISAIAAQVSVAFRNAGLFQQVQRRSVQLLTASEVSRAATSILEPNLLIQQTVNLIQDRFNLYYVGMFLVDTSGEWTNDPGRWAVLRAGTGEAGRIQIERGHKLEINTESMIGTCILESKAQTPQSLRGDIPRYVNPLLPKTRSEIALPLISRGQVVGAMSIQSEIENAFTGEDISILQTMADQVANALQNANLFNQTQARAGELAVLNEMSRGLSQKLDINTILRNVYLFASRLVDTSTFFIALYEEDTNLISFPFATEKNREIQIPTRELSAGLTEYVIRNREAILIQKNIEGWLREHGVELRLTGDMSQSWLGVPLSIGDQTLGIICIQNDEPYHFSENHRDLLNAIANQSAIALQNAQLFTQTQEALSETEALLSITNVASSSLDIQETLANVLDQILETIDSEAGLITIANAQSNKLELIAYRLPEQMAKGIQENGLDGSLCDLVYQQATPLVSENLAEHSPTDASGAIALGFHSYQGVPLEAKGKILGTLCTFSTRTLSPGDSAINLLQAVGRQIGVAIENANLFEQIQEQANELAVLNEMSRVLSRQFDIDEIIKTIHEYTSRLMDTTYFFIGLYNQREDEVSFPFVIEQGEVSRIPSMKKRRGLTQHVIDTKQPLLITENVNQKILDLGLETIIVGAPAESWLGVPLIIGDDVLGVIATQNADTPRVFNERHQDLLVSIARQSAIAVQTARLFQETLRQSDDLAVLNEMSRVLTSILDRHKMMDTIYEYTSRIMDTTNFFIATYNKNNVEVTIEYNVLDNQKAEGQIRTLGNGLTDYILRTGESLLLEDDIPGHMARLGIDFVPLGDSNPPLAWMGVPMLIGDDVIGAIAVQSITTPRLYSERHRDLLLSIASQTAISLQNVQLIQQTQQRSQEMTLLYQAGADLNAVRSYDDILKVIQNHTILGNAATNISINLFDKPWVGDERPNSYLPISRWSLAPYDDSQSQRYLINSWETAEQFLKREHPTIIQDIANDPGLEETARQNYMDDYHAQCLVFAPLVLAGRWFGEITSIYSEKQTFTDDEIQRMMTLVSQAAVAVQNLRSLDDSLRRAGQLETAAEIARDTSATLSVDELINRGVNAVRDRFGFYHASIFLIDEFRKSAVVSASTGEAGAEMIRQGHQLPIGSQSIIGQVTLSGEPLIVNDVTQNANHRPNPLLPDTQAELGIPLKIGNRVIGAMDVQSVEKNAFNIDDVAVLQTLADQISVGIDNARSYQLAQNAIEETRRRVQDLTTLSLASQTLASAPLEIQEVATIIAHQVGEIIPENTTTSISIRDLDNPDLMRLIVSSSRMDGKTVLDENPDAWNFNLTDYPATATVINSSKPLTIHLSDPEVDPSEAAYMQAQGVGTLLIVPLAVKGQVIGIMELETWNDEYHYSSEETNLLTTLANQAAISLENARLYEEQLETSEQLRELDKLKSQFLANMSHELRTPLNSIIGFSRVIMKGIDGPVTDLQQQDLSAIYNAGQHLLKMINDILDISKIDAGKMELAFEDVNITEVINSVMSTARGLVKDKPIQLVTAIADNLPIIIGDSTRIRQVLLNLLSNAAKFTDEGSITVTAQQQINYQGNLEIYLSVSDTGIGIPKEEQEKLFEPFVQVDGSPTRATGGTGLGLSITRMLVELHGGEIDLESEPGKGSKFFFNLPIDSTTPFLTAEKRKPKILAIDDDLQVMQLYDRYLTGTAFQIVPLDDPSIALAYAREIQPFAIALDILLPNLDGWRLLEELKKHPETKHIPVVICSIVDEPEKAISLGAEDYLVKPILADDFVNVMTRIWEKSSQRVAP